MWSKAYQPRISTSSPFSQGCKYLCIISFTLSIMPISSMSEETNNYCLEPSVNTEWATMLNNYPNDKLVVKLFALRIGLCELVKRKLINVDRATDIFESVRGKGVANRMKDEQRQKQKEGGGT